MPLRKFFLLLKNEANAFKDKTHSIFMKKKQVIVLIGNYRFNKVYNYLKILGKKRFEEIRKALEKLNTTKFLKAEKG